jgi:hypothetical protein
VCMCVCERVSVSERMIVGKQQHEKRGAREQQEAQKEAREHQGHQERQKATNGEGRD